jgi:hypothetical protein
MVFGNLAQVSFYESSRLQLNSSRSSLNTAKCNLPVMQQ